MLTSFLRVLVIYPIVVFGVRLMGKRQIGELQPTELVVTILISNIATLPLEDQNLPLLMGIVPMLVLICFEVLMSWAVLRSRKLRHLLSGAPQIIIRDGKIDQKKMTELRFSLDDLMTSLRSLGIFDLTEVQLAVVETNGQVSAYQKAQARAATCGDLRLRVPDQPPPEVLIADGCLSEDGMTAAGCSNDRLNRILQHHGLAQEDVFLLTADQNGVKSLIRKEASV
ncbi:MAG: DUF421 domain-containing protein [Oscillospiraceae bacterium]|nr:DUF421 domain-containing protein [Oscillospiraceae bacterium]